MKNLIFILSLIAVQLGFGQKTISQEDATNLLIAVPEVHSILVAHQNDSTVTNKLIEEHSEPNDEYYYYRIAQFFSYSKHTVTLWHFRVNKTSKEIMVMDVVEGDYILLKEWQKKQNKKKKGKRFKGNPKRK